MKNSKIHILTIFLVNFSPNLLIFYFNTQKRLLNNPKNQKTYFELFWANGMSFGQKNVILGI